MRRVLFSTAVALFLALGCAPSEEPPPPPDLEAERASLIAADKAWFQAYSTSETPVDVLASQFVEDASLLPPGAPLVQGREAIREAFAQLEAMPGYDLTFRPSSAHVGGGDLGYTIGTYEMAMAPEEQPIRIVGKYMTVWRKQADGTWMVAADMFNADGPPTPIGE